jgi:hypothetical protein
LFWYKKTVILVHGTLKTVYQIYTLNVKSKKENQSFFFGTISCFPFEQSAVGTTPVASGDVFRNLRYFFGGGWTWLSMCRLLSRFTFQIRITYSTPKAEPKFNFLGRLEAKRRIGMAASGKMARHREDPVRSIPSDPSLQNGGSVSARSIFFGSPQDGPKTTRQEDAIDVNAAPVAGVHLGPGVPH